MSRIQKRIEQIKKQNRKGLVTFTMAYDPDRETSLDMLKSLAANGADILEVGVPFSDPMADGPVIQEAGKRAIAAGATLAGIIELVHEFRQSDNSTPIILMGYYNPIYHYGVEEFCVEAAEAGVDGLIIVDLPPEEEGEITPYLGELDFIRLIAPTSDDNRIKHICANASGFVYYVAITGITGTRSANADALASAMTKIRRHTKLPIAAGFGIKTPSDAANAAASADLVVVGSAIVDRIKNEGKDSTLALVRDMAAAMSNKAAA